MTEPTRYRRGKAMSCPHCGGTVSVGIEVELTGDLKAIPDLATGSATPTEVNPPFLPTELALLERAEAGGLLDAYSRALLASQPGGPAALPKDHRKMFVQFFRLAVPKTVPRWALAHFATEHSPARVEFFGANGVVAVTADRRVVAFMPYALVKGAAVRSLAGGQKMRLDAEQDQFLAWVRTRHGYVTGKGAFFDALQQKSRGDFARLVQ